MVKQLKKLPIFLFILAMVPFASAATLTVDTNDPACGDINGTPYCTIQAAINDANSSDTVFIMNGNYDEALSITKNGLTLTGESRAGVIVNAQNASYTLFVHANNTLVNTLTLTGAAAFTTHIESSQDFLITDTTAIGQGQFYNNSNNGVGGFDFINVQNVAISNVLSEQHSKNGISFTGSQNINISDVTIQDNGQTEGWAGIALYTFSPFFPGNTTGVLISGTNTISNTPMGIYLEDFIGFSIDASATGTTTFSSQTVAPLVRLGFGDVPNADTFALSLGLPSKGSGGVPTIPTISGYFQNNSASTIAALLAPSPSTSVVFDLIENYFFIGVGLNISAAVDAASNNDAVFIANGNHDLSQITISKNISFYGESKSGTILNSVVDTGSSGDPRGWILVDTGFVFNVMNLTMDGSGNKIWQAIRHKGTGTIDTVGFQNILFDESGPSYAGTALAAFGNGNVDVYRSMFMNIGRIGVQFFGTGITGSVYNNNTYVGKGSGDFLDYGVEVGGGAVAIINNSMISGNRGIASSDNSSSACILVTTFFGGGTTATILNNDLTDCTTGIAVGFDNTDTSSVVANFNSIVGNEHGVSSTAPLVDAVNNWWGSCDGPSGEGPGTGDSVSTNVTFDPWDGKDGNPQIGTCVNKTNPFCVFSSQNVSIVVDVVSAPPVSSATLLYWISGMMFEKPMQQFGTEYRATLFNTELPVSEQITWNVMINYTDNTTFTNGNKTFYVANNTYLIVDPPVPDGNGMWYISEPTFTLFSDMNASATYYAWEDDIVREFVSPFGLENISNLQSITAGTLGLYYFSDFGVCNETDNLDIFYVDLFDPIITPTFPKNNSVIYNNFAPNITVHLDEKFQSNSGINVSNIVFFLDGDMKTFEYWSHNNGHDVDIWFIPDNLSEGQHTVLVFATDNAGRNASLEFVFNITSTPAFGLTVLSPVDGTINSRRALFNISAGSELTELKFINHNNQRPRERRLCRNCMDYTRNQILSEGYNNVTIIAKDSFGTVMTVSRIVFVDSIKPRIIKTEPRRNVVFNGTGFKVTYKELNLDSVTLHVGSSNHSLTCSSGEREMCSIDVDLSAYEGQKINYQFEVADSQVSRFSRAQSITVDTIDPVLNLVAPVNGSVYNRRVPFNMTASEDVFLEYMDLTDTRPRWKRLCRNCDSVGTTREKLRSFRRGDHDLIIRARDGAGQTDERMVSFTVV